MQCASFRALIPYSSLNPRKFRRSWINYIVACKRLPLRCQSCQNQRFNFIVHKLTIIWATTAETAEMDALWPLLHPSNYYPLNWNRKAKLLLYGSPVTRQRLVVSMKATAATLQPPYPTCASALLQLLNAKNFSILEFFTPLWAPADLGAAASII